MPSLNLTAWFRTNFVSGPKTLGLPKEKHAKLINIFKKLLLKLKKLKTLENDLLRSYFQQCKLKIYQR